MCPYGVRARHLTLAWGHDRATRGCYIDILAAAEGFIFLMNLSVFRNLFAFDGAL